MSYTQYKNPYERIEWLKLRNTGIGGSDAGTVIGLSKWKSKYTLWAEKTGMLPIQDKDNEKMRQGRDLEEYVAQRFAEKTGAKVRRSRFMYRSIEYPWMLANIDRFVYKDGEPKAGLECKTMSQFTRYDLENGEIPPQYYAQCIHYMIVTGISKWYICILRFQEEPYIFEIDSADEAVKEDMDALIEAEKIFWESVKAHTPPPVDGSESSICTLKGLYQGDDGGEIELLEPEYIKQYLKFDGMIKDLQEKKKECEANIKAEMQDSTYAHSEFGTATWKSSKARQTVDTKMLKEKYPTAYADCLKTGEPIRRFTVKPPKERKEGIE